MNDKIRKVIWITVVVIAIGWAYHLFSGPFEASVGVNQLEDSKVTYSLSQFVSGGGVGKVLGLVWFVLVGVVLAKKAKNTEGGTK